MKTVQLHIPTENEMLNELPQEVRELLAVNIKGTFHDCYLESLDRMLRSAQRPNVKEPVITFFSAEKRGNSWFWGTVLRDLQAPDRHTMNWYGEMDGQNVEGGGIMYSLDDKWIRVVGY